MNARIALWLAAAGLAVAGIASGMALAGHAKSETATVKAAFNKTLNKTVLATASGLTLYRNTRETRGHVSCGPGCTAEWPPLLVPKGRHPTAGAGVTAAKLGTLKRPDGSTQVTYGGMRLYRFAGDRTAGAAKGEGVGGIWFAVTPKPSPASAAPSTTTTTTTTTTSTQSGYSY
jgi:predicted lipoprotein with Yx(FWY)xxD motif